MRLVTYEFGGQRRAGAFVNEDRDIVDLAAGAQAIGLGAAPLTSVLALVEGGEAALEVARRVVDRAPSSALVQRAEVRLLAPIQPPPQLRDCSCFEAHLRGSFDAAMRFSVRNAPDPEAAYRAIDRTMDERVIATFQRQPIYYKANRFSVVGEDEEVVWPSYSKVIDFELEWACYIARHAKDVAAEDAGDYIFGYTIYNDFSARDAQAREMAGMLGPAKGKDFDTGNVMGPCLVTADEIPDPYNLTMVARVNGEEWGRGTTADMRWTFPDVIAHISRSETLHPGEALGSGTVGTGCGLEQLRYLSPGDVVELEVERIGILRSRIALR
ncbi:MAG: fumarylacetoacetate hydrolase family protein [Allosphingosinicella sp.]|uniref:fumarylacetoacetate hydrolase family protein n=1 Tax=Allosphingosinicella sp. TaxID=2823234 RepID=UPI00393106A4